MIKTIASKKFSPKVPILQVVLLFRMQPCPLFSLSFVWVCYCTHPKVSEKKQATGQSCIQKRSTSYIGTFALYLHKILATKIVEISDVKEGAKKFSTHCQVMDAKS
mgnify:CR=1 FL=1